MRIIEILVLVYFSYVTIYTIVFYFAGLLYEDVTFNYLDSDTLSKFCIIIPAYKEDSVIKQVVKESLKQNYPKHLFDIYVVADKLQDKTIEELNKLPIHVIVVSFEESTKVKSINEALTRIDINYDMIVVLDADNIMEANFLSKVNYLHSLGLKVIQTKRVPKNQTNGIEILDGLSEGINYNLVSKGSVVLGASPGLKGSGMSFHFDIFKDTISKMKSVGGFDRELELKLIEQNVKIIYSSTTLVYDEKVSSVQVFKKQRTRWISSQFFYLKKYFKKGVKNLLTGNITYFNSAVLRNIQLPRLLNLGLLSIIAVLLFLIRDKLKLPYELWPTLLLVNLLITIASIPKEFFTPNLLSAIIRLPLIFAQMFLVLFKLKDANKKFIHTPKTVKLPNEN